MPGGKGFRAGQFSSPHRNRRRLPAEKNSLRRKNVPRFPRFCRIRGSATDRASLETWERFLTLHHSVICSRRRRPTLHSNALTGIRHKPRLLRKEAREEELIRAARRGNEKPSAPKCSEGL